jgi:hypothetical protein
MRPIRYLLCCALAFGLVGSLAALYHYRADRWGVFARDYQSFHKRIMINKLYLKTRYLLHERHDFDCYMFGSSRLAAVDARHFGERCYNFTHSAGLVVDHLRVVKTLLHAGLPLERVYIGIDELSYNEDPSLAPLQHMRRAYPTNPLEFLGFGRLFLARPPELTDLGLVTGRNPKDKTPRFILDPNLDTERIRQYYQKHFDNPRNTDVRFRRLRGLAERQKYHGRATMEALRELKSLSDKHGFKLEVFFMPLHYKTYLARNFEWFTDFKREVASIQPFWDFSGLNAYTTDNRYWRETSHFSAAVGDVVAKTLIDNTAAGDGRTGRLITLDNIDRQEAIQLEVDAAYLPLLIRREGVMPIPRRFVDHWNSDGLLRQGGVTRSGPPTFIDLVAGGKVHLTREHTGRDRLGEARAELRRGDFFVFEYQAESKQRKQLQLQVAHDRHEYGRRFREYRLHLNPGSNTGLFAGYASIDLPKIRLVLGGGEAEVAWQPLRVKRIDLPPVAVLFAEGYDDHYPAAVEE